MHTLDPVLRSISWWFLLFMALFISCMDETGRTSNEGRLSLELVSDTALMPNQTRASSLSELNSFANTADYAVEILQGTTSIQKFDRYDKMSDEISLSAGDYTIQVSKGENEAAAFSSPYFAGKQNFKIVEGMTTPVTVTASLANSRVTVDLTDDFLETYPKYTLSFMTNKMKTPLVYEAGKPMYFQADAAGTKLTIAMELVNVYGKEVEYTATTTIKPKQWAALTVRTDEKGINGLAVDVTLNDGTNETIYVNIGIPDFMEQLKGAPLVASSFFNWDGNESMTEAYALEAKDAGSFVEVPSISVIAGGKVAKAILSVTKGDESILNVDLANLTEEEKLDLETQYVFGLPEEIKNQTSFEFDVTGLLNSFKPEKEKQAEYLISLSITDALPEFHVTTKLVKVTLNEPQAPEFSGALSAISGSVGKFEDFLGLSKNLQITHKQTLTSCTFTLKEKTSESVVQQGYVDLEKGTVINESEISGLTWSDNKNTAKFNIQAAWLNQLASGSYILTVTVKDELDFEASKELPISVAGIEWDIRDVDIWGSKVTLRIKPIDVNENLDLDKVQFIYNNEVIATGSSLTKNDDASISFVWEDLQPGTSYVTTAEYDGIPVETTFRTESNVQLLNNEFLNWTVQDWTYKVTLKGNRTDKNYNFLLGNWNTNNNETLLSEVADIYFIVQVAEFSQKLFPTVTYADEGLNDKKSAVIRSVSANTLNTNEIMSDAVAGEIYYTGELTSRPTSLSYTYKYMPYSSDKYKIYVKIIGDSGTTLVEQTYIPETSASNDGFVVNTIPLTYSSLVEKAKSIEVHFYSSEQNEPPTEKNRMVTLPQPNGNTYKTHSGSTLIIDNVILNY